MSELKTRPDYALTVRDTLVGFIEVKAPGKGADPRKFKDRHDKEQWEKLQTLPNLIYTDGNEFSLWRSGQPEGALVRLIGDIETSGANLAAPPDLLGLFENFIRWLHTFGERFVDPTHGRPLGPPRLPSGVAPRIPAGGAISEDPAAMPDTIAYDEANRRLLIGTGYVDGVAPEVWSYEVSGKQVLRQWFSYRKANRERPIIGDRRPPSKLGDIQPNHWLAEYTTELINVLNVIGRLIELEPSQAELLEQICSSPTISAGELPAAGVLVAPAT